MPLTKSRSNYLILYNITWQQFENLQKNLGENSATRMTYDRGILEIMTPLPEHEYYKEAISIAIEDIAEVLEKDYECLGSTTWKKEASLAGIEPDNCFYFQNEAKIRGQLEFDLERDPPPDLALEIDLSNKSLSRFPIYARLGIPELWCYDSGKLTIYQLGTENQQYIKTETSLIFPSLPIQDLPRLIEQHRQVGKRQMRKAIREWVKQTLPTQP